MVPLKIGIFKRMIVDCFRNDVGFIDIEINEGGDMWHEAISRDDAIALIGHLEKVFEIK